MEERQEEEEGDLEMQTEEETETEQKQDRDGATTLTYPALVDWINRRRLRILACIFSTVDLDSKEEGPQLLLHLVCPWVQEEQEEQQQQQQQRQQEEEEEPPVSMRAD